MATTEPRQNQKQAQKPRASQAEEIDPVCGMKLQQPDPGLSITRNGDTHYFCSKECMAAFRTDPEQYS